MYSLTFPKMRPDFPRSSSNESGFFFCGIMLDPVLIINNQQNFQKITGSQPVSITEGDEPKFCGRVDDQIFRHFADVDHCQASPHHKFSDEVTIADTPQTVFSNGLETQFFSEEVSVNRERIARKSTTPKWKD